ncbi:MAG: hypothetical protein R3211_09330 [Balneolaceae bacterium]|nr:hypothetical protein [Balneolaceae bacterium]
MKTLSAIMSAMLLMFNATTVAQESSQNIKKTARFADPGNTSNQLKVYNINGAVTVEGYGGDEIRVEAKKRISADNDELVRKGFGEVNLTVKEQGDLVLIYLDAPFIEMKHRNDRINYRIDRHEDDYEFRFDINIRVPRNVNLHASTINRGNVTVRDITGELSASNINGSVELTGIAGKTRAHTINGDITARYTKSPATESKYETINGTIEVYYPEDLSADIRFKSLHGDLYTNFENIRLLAGKAKTERARHKGKTVYSIDKFSPYRIGGGGPELRFEVLNGDVYIKKINS